MGYHQIRASKEMQEKLAFQGPDAIKRTYNVMPFGPMNGPATFVTMIHNVDSMWKETAKPEGVNVGSFVDTTIIINNIMNWAKSFEVALKYIVCQLHICKAYHLTLSLKKSHFFTKHFEFVGINISSDGNQPAMLKHELLKHWPIPELVRNVASFVGFLQFSSKFILHFEIRVKLFQWIMERAYTEAVGDLWMPEVQATFNDLCGSIMCNPCLRRFDLRKVTVFALTFWRKALVMLYASLTMTKHPLPLHLSSCLGMGFISSPKRMVGHFTPLHSGHAALAGMRNSSIHT
jgi:hypothetical protein